MVAVLVALSFLGFFLVDHWLHRRDPDLYGRVPVPVSRFSLPDPGTFVTSNHLTVVMSEAGRMLLKPDSFLSVALGAARIEPAAREHVHAGERLYNVSMDDVSLEVTAPFSGRVIATTGDTVLFQPDDTAAAVRKLFIGEALGEWWQTECRRLSRFLGETSTFSTSLADGGHLAAGYLGHLDPAEQRRFARIFLQRGGDH